MKQIEQPRIAEVLPEETKQRQDLALLEAALYVAGRPLDLKTLCPVLKTRSAAKIKRLATILSEDYKARHTALEVLELADERFVLQLKPKFTSYVRRLAIRPLLSSGPLKTLSYIAFRQPISQAHVVAVRGSHAYGHVKQLEELGLIVRERVKRGFVMKTTEFFADYFGFSHDARIMKRQLKDVFKDSVEEGQSELPE
ncbi:MAG TPA: SMC-Scp complex subunit ScpB [Candidatus Bathyarchaeia archaeon]|nr:SMC-Scp complex subunit ScpB [Candidatus Bathyarchaeia archaeon]